MAYPDQLANKLKHTRLGSGLSQTDFAEKLGIKQSYLSAMERGVRKVPMTVANLLIEQFKVSADWLFEPDSTNTNSDSVPIERTSSRTNRSDKGDALTDKQRSPSIFISHSSKDKKVVDTALLASHFDVEELEPRKENPWAVEYVIELQQNQHWLNIDRQLRLVLSRLLRVQELLEDLVGIRFDDTGFEALRKKANRQMNYDSPDGPSDPIAEMSEAQKRAYYASRERLLEQCEAQFTEHLNTLHQSITHTQNLHLTPRKGSAGEALRPFLEQRHQERYGNDKNE